MENKFVFIMTLFFDDTEDQKIGVFSSNSHQRNVQFNSLLHLLASNVNTAVEGVVNQYLLVKKLATKKKKIAKKDSLHHYVSLIRAVERSESRFSSVNA